MKQSPQLTLGCFIRTKHRGEWEYAVWNGHDTRTVICSQSDLNEWKEGAPIEPLFCCDNKQLQYISKLYKEALRDGATVIQCVWKGGELQPRRAVTS